MASSLHLVQIYEQLADYENQRGAPQMRDRYLVLAADAALSAGVSGEAERLRTRLLEYNPHHMLKPFHSLAEAMRSPDVLNYLVNLRRICSPETAERILHSQLKPKKTPANQTAPVAVPAATGHSPDPPVYRLQDESMGPSHASQSLAAETRAANALPARAKPEPAPWRDLDQPSASVPLSGGGLWVATGLYWVGLLAGLTLAGYVLGRAFWVVWQE
jgi:hypothetical protein